VYVEQLFFILSGTATMTLSDKVFMIETGKGIYLPARQPHRMSNDGSENLHFIVSSTPPSQGGSHFVIAIMLVIACSFCLS
jgi:mannose-6-phosphate isomerase-like protein (cupin superfamily)